MGFGPVVRGSNKREKDREVLQAYVAQHALQGVEAASGVGRLKERCVAHAKIACSSGNLGRVTRQRRLLGFAECEGRLQTVSTRQRRRIKATTSSIVCTAQLASPDGRPNPRRNPAWRAMQ